MRREVSMRFRCVGGDGGCWGGGKSGGRGGEGGQGWASVGERGGFKRGEGELFLQE